jgi:serine O-acetyltransferase
MSVPLPFTMSMGPADHLVVALIRAQGIPLLGLVIRQWLKFMGTDVPHKTIAGSRGFVLQHGGKVVVHYKTVIGDNVALMQHSSIGRGDVWRQPHPDFGGVVLENDVIIGAGAAVLCSRGTLTVRRGTVVGANAVLTCSTGENELWAGAPARLVGRRNPPVGTRSSARQGSRAAQVAVSQ